MGDYIANWPVFPALIFGAFVWFELRERVKSGDWYWDKLEAEWHKGRDEKNIPWRDIIVTVLGFCVLILLLGFGTVKIGFWMGIEPVLSLLCAFFLTCGIATIYLDSVRNREILEEIKCEQLANEIANEIKHEYASKNDRLDEINRQIAELETSWDLNGGMMRRKALHNAMELLDS